MTTQAGPDDDGVGPLEPLVVDDVTHRFGNLWALDGVSLSLRTGVTALVGVNGAGKTTLMSTICGALRPTSGRVLVSGHDPYRWRSRQAALRRVSVMPQVASFPGGMTAREVVEYLAWMRGLSPRAARAKASEALEHVDLTHRARAKIRTLSGGMVRRVALAQALASDAEVVLLDEPSTGLDPEQRRIMVDLIGGLGRTVLMSSHVLEDVTDVAHRIVVLHEGRVVFEGSVSQLREQAPVGTDLTKAAEAGFLRLITASRAGAR